MKSCQGLCQNFELQDESLSHFWAFLNFLAGCLPVRGAMAVAGLFANVLVDDLVDIFFVCISHLYFSFLQNAVKPFPTSQDKHLTNTWLKVEYNNYQRAKQAQDFVLLIITERGIMAWRFSGWFEVH